MPTHEFICDDCEHTETDVTAIYAHQCPLCGKTMRWNAGNIAVHMGRGGRKHGGGGDYRHVSDSLAMNPSQIPEHRKLFPDVEVLPDGRPVFTSVKQQERYAEKCGFYKKPQRTRKRGKKIA